MAVPPRPRGHAPCARRAFQSRSVTLTASETADSTIGETGRKTGSCAKSLVICRASAGPTSQAAAQRVGHEAITVLGKAPERARSGLESLGAHDSPAIGQRAGTVDVSCRLSSAIRRRVVVPRPARRIHRVVARAQPDWRCCSGRRIGPPFQAPSRRGLECHRAAGRRRAERFRAPAPPGQVGVRVVRRDTQMEAGPRLRFGRPVPPEVFAGRPNPCSGRGPVHEHYASIRSRMLRSL
jgi:hypothetical protein